MTEMDINAAIVERARGGAELTEAELLELDGVDVLSIGMLADEIRRARVGDRVGFARVLAEVEFMFIPRPLKLVSLRRRRRTGQLGWRDQPIVFEKSHKHAREHPGRGRLRDGVGSPILVVLRRPLRRPGPLVFSAQLLAHAWHFVRLAPLEQIGFDLTLLTVFGGALGVGIGLGLQKLASNYIAGFAILLDRSIRLGDLVTVDNRTGVVTRVTSRYVVIRGGDGLEAIVPNEALITNTVLNHSSTATRIRIAIQVQVSYDCYVEAALAILREMAERQPEVLGGDQAPSAMVINLADSGITLELGVWIDNPHIQGRLKSALYRGVLDAFARHGIDIPFPRRDVRLVGAASPDGRPSANPAPNPN